MKIVLENIGRRYNQDWILKGVNYTFKNGQTYALLGPNGSGKSTLIKLIAGSLTPSIGALQYISKGKKIDVEDIYRHISFVAPYVELIEEFTLYEMIDFHFSFKSLLRGFTKQDIFAFLALDLAGHKELKYFSSGMKQRVKLALACFTDSDILMLDEPTSNLDEEGEDWYLKLIKDTVHENRVLIVASNQQKEYSFCSNHIQILDYK